jgi:hypothetical protein
MIRSRARSTRRAVPGKLSPSVSLLEIVPPGNRQDALPLPIYRRGVVNPARWLVHYVG